MTNFFLHGQAVAVLLVLQFSLTSFKSLSSEHERKIKKG